MRRSDGARVIQLPSGCIPMISECACWATWRTSVARYFSGIQSRGSIRSWRATVSSNPASSCCSAAASGDGHGVVAPRRRITDRSVGNVPQAWHARARVRQREVRWLAPGGRHERGSNHMNVDHRRPDRGGRPAGRSGWRGPPPSASVTSWPSTRRRAALGGAQHRRRAIPAQEARAREAEARAREAERRPSGQGRGRPARRPGADDSARPYDMSQAQQEDHLREADRVDPDVDHESSRTTRRESSRSDPDASLVEPGVGPRDAAAA